MPLTGCNTSTGRKLATEGPEDTMRFCFLLCAAATLLQGGTQDWELADRATRRLAPALFVDVPRPIRDDLERRGCTIPQTYLATRRVNIISGRFTSRNQIDWAALCSRNLESVILVYRAGSPSNVAVLAPQADRNFLQTIDGAGRIGFSRELGAVGATFIREHNHPDGTVKLPVLNHEGINDMFLEKASVVWYWHDGRWLEFAGAD